MLIRRLRGLAAQLLLWTIFPLAVVLIVLSLAGVTRHRQVMIQMVEDRDRGLTLAEATRLAHEVDVRADSLARAAARVAVQEDTVTAVAVLSGVVEGLADHFPAGLALLDADQVVSWASPAAGGWSTTSQAHDLAKAVAAAHQPRYADLSDSGILLLIGAPVSGDSGHILLGALPIETLPLAESSLVLDAEHAGASFVLGQAGTLIHHAGLSHSLDMTTLADLPAAPPDAAAVTHLRDRQGRELLVTYARVDPPGWTLITTEDLRAISSMGMTVVEVLPMLLLFVAVVALLAVSFGVANIVRPLQELDRRAARVAWGDFDAVKEPVGGVQEMDDLRVTLAQMAERLRSYQTGMRDYLSAVTRAQEEERARLAHELHDDTVQALIALRQRAQMARKSLTNDPARAIRRLDELESLIDQELAALRRLIGDLRPIYLDDLGFVPALEMLARQTETEHGLAVTVRVVGEIARLAPDLELAAFRIAQQALSNVAAHAAAQNVALEVGFAADGLTVTVTDDGRGFAPPDQPAELARAGHFGLMGMRERALLYGGHLTVASQPGTGTIITAWLPIC